MTTKDTAEQAVRDIRRKTRKQYSAEEKIRIVLEGLRGEESIAALCRREGIAESLYYSWSKEFLEAGKKRLAGDTARQATSNEVKTLRAETRNLKEALTDLQPAILLAPAVVRLFRYPDPPAHFSNGSALRQQHIRFPQMVDDLFDCKTFPRHLCSLQDGSRGRISNSANGSG